MGQQQKIHSLALAQTDGVEIKRRFIRMILPLDLPITNGRILLREQQREDLEELYTLTADQTLWAWFPGDLSVRTDLKQWIEESIRDPNRIPFVVIEKASGNLIGSTSIGNIAPRDKRAEIGWTFLGRNFQGKGFNAEVKHTLIRLIFEEWDFERVEFKTDVLNQPARKAMEKLGFVREGILRSHTLMNKGRRRDTLYYSVLREEWPALKERNGWQ